MSVAACRHPIEIMSLPSTHVKVMRSRVATAIITCNRKLQQLFWHSRDPVACSGHAGLALLFFQESLQ